MSLPFVGQTPTQVVPRGGASWQGFWCQNYGPYKVGQNYYLFLCNIAGWDSEVEVPESERITGSFIHAYKSEDAGSTWEIQDMQVLDDWPAWKAHESVANSRWNISFDGTKFWILYGNTNIPVTSRYLHYLTLGYFDTSIDTWIPDHCSVKGPQFNYLADRVTYTNYFYNDRNTAIITRNDGVLVIFYTGEPNISEWSTLWYITYNIVTGWGTPVKLVDTTEHAYPLNAVITSEDRIHLFYAQTATVSSATTLPHSLHHITIDEDFSVGTPQGITTDFAKFNWPTENTGRPVIGYDPLTTKLVIAFGGEIGEAGNSWISKFWVAFADDAVDPSWTLDQVPFPYTVENPSLYYWSTLYYHTYGGSDLTAWVEGTDIYVIAATYEEDPISSYVKSSVLWCFKRDTDGVWTNANIFEFTEVDNTRWLLGGPSVQIGQYGARYLAFWAYNNTSTNNYTNEANSYNISERIYALVEGSTVITLDLSDSFTLNDSLIVRRSTGSIPGTSVPANCPDIIIGSVYCDDWKDALNGDEDSHVTRVQFYDIQTEPCQN